MIRFRGKIDRLKPRVFARIDRVRRLLVLAAEGDLPLVIDTGFTDGLMVPAHVIRRLHAPLAAHDDFELADGRVVRFPCYVGQVKVGRRIVPAQFMPGDGLIGMEFMETAFRELRMDFQTGALEFLRRPHDRRHPTP